MLLEPEQQPGVDAPGSGGHHQTLERREAHGRVDRPAGLHRSERRSRTEVAGDDAQFRHVAFEQLAHAPYDVCVRESVGAVAPQCPSLVPLGGQGVGRGSIRQAGVERRVEARHGWHVELVHRGSYRLDGGRILTNFRHHPFRRHQSRGEISPFLFH